MQLPNYISNMLLLSQWAEKEEPKSIEIDPECLIRRLWEFDPSYTGPKGILYYEGLLTQFQGIPINYS